MSQSLFPLFKPHICGYAGKRVMVEPDPASYVGAQVFFETKSWREGKRVWAAARRYTNREIFRELKESGRFRGFKST